MPVEKTTDSAEVEKKTRIESFEPEDFQPQIKNREERKNTQIESSITPLSTEKAPHCVQVKKTAGIEPFETQNLQPQATKQANVLEPPESVSFTPIVETPYKSPLIATGLSLIVPGLGHLYLKEPAQAGALFCVYVGLGAYSIETYLNTTKEKYYKPLPYETDVEITAYNWEYYSIYAAYRDARIFNSQTSYPCSGANDTLGALMYAPFSFQIMKKPEVWGSILGFLALAEVIEYVAYSDFHILQTMNTDHPPTHFPGSAFAVGIGEEAFFRGVIQPILIEATNPRLGIFFTSALFGLAHIENAENLPEEHQEKYYLYCIPFIATAGGYLGYLTYKNQSLQEAVAVHSWYDFVLFAFDYFTQEPTELAGCVEKPRYWSLSWSF